MEQLMKTAKELNFSNMEAIQEYAEKREHLVAKVNQIMLGRQDIFELINEKHVDMMKDNHSNHARFVETILRHYNPEVLIETVLWVFRTYRSRGFHPSYWPAQLNTWVAVLKDSVSPKTFQAIYPLYNWFIVNIPAFTAISDRQIKAFSENEFSV